MLRRGERLAKNPAAAWNRTTIASTRAKRQPGESSSQCAATNSSTPAPSVTEPKMVASSTGQLTEDSSLASLARRRSAREASMSPACVQRFRADSMSRLGILPSRLLERLVFEKLQHYNMERKLCLAKSKSFKGMLERRPGGLGWTIVPVPFDVAKAWGSLGGL